MKLIKPMLAALLVTTLSSTSALAITHQEVFPQMRDMVRAMSDSEYIEFQKSFCRDMFAAILTAQSIRGDAAELGRDPFTIDQIFERSGDVAVEFATIYASVCK